MLAGDWQKLKSNTVDARDASKLMVKWQALADHALDSAGYNAPELVLPILKHCALANLATVQQGPNLLMAMPIQEGVFFNSSWTKPLPASGAPHVSESLKEATLEAFMLAQTKPFRFSAIPAQGQFHTQLLQQAERYEIYESWQRACLRPEGTYENWLQTNFDQKRRKEFKRLRNRLSEQGALRTETLKKESDVVSFTEDLLALEVAGWKGKRGTAISADQNLATALRESLQYLHAAGKLRFWSLKLDGKSIASLFAIVEGKQAWLGKIAYDETFAKFSPGALIILDCTESFFAEDGIKLVDSSAVPDHPLIDRIWRDRLSMISVLVAPETVSKNYFNAIANVTKFKLKWRSKLRDAFYKAKGKKRS